MNRHAVGSLGRSLAAVVAVALASACADGTAVGPDGGATPAAARAAGATSHAPANGGRAVELGACTNLRAPAGSKLAFHVYAQGVQIYRWTGTRWSFEGPSAVLSADAGGRSTVGIHYAGPTWQSVSGGSVTGAVLDRCTPDPDAIPWLSLEATPDGGPGIFRRVTFIQRVNTVGGTEPAQAGSFVGQEERVPYTAEYFFYRAG